MIKADPHKRQQARKHGGKSRVRRNSHIGIDEKPLEIRAGDFTIRDADDTPTLPRSIADAITSSPTGNPSPFRG